MQIRKRITITYVTLSVLSTLLLCLAVLALFRQNNRYYFIKRLQDRAKIVASIHYQNDPKKAEYYRKLKSEGLEELIDEKDFVLKVNGENSFELNTDLELPVEFYTDVLRNQSGWVEDNHRYYYGQIFDESGQKYIVIITAKDRRGDLSTLYMIRILFIGGVAFIILAYFLGRFLARRVVHPVSQITREVKRISASNLHNRLPQPENQDEMSDLTQTFNDMLDRLETSFEIQANFINNASHELKTPITTITAEAEIMLSKTREPAAYQEALSVIYNQATRLGNLTESLLKLTQTGYDGQKQVKDVARLDELLFDVKAELDKLLPDNRVIVRLEDLPEDEALLLLPCNRPLIELALSNIISNGVKYSNNETVFVTLSVQEKQLVVTISDIGIGIPPEDIPHLYEPFFRGKEASRYNGYGLGLPLAMKIIRMHNGEIKIQSQPEQGTIVTIVFRKD